MPTDGRGLVRGIELQPGLAGGAELVISWNRIEQFVLAPSAGMRGLRIRVPRRRTSQVLVDEEPGPAPAYSVNLISTRERLDETALAKAAALLQVPVYLSDATVQDETWHRLRAGPFSSRRDAERLLREARSSYPTAWLAIDDETDADSGGEDASATQTRSPAGPRLPENRADPELDRKLASARTALSRRKLDDAIPLLTQVVASEDYVHRVDAAELLGLARERKGQLAQAKAVYEDFLRRYPDAAAAPRVKQRLQALRTAGLPGRRGSGGAGEIGGWTLAGNASQIYRRDNSEFSSDDFARSLVTQNVLITDLDGLARRRGERFDFTARTSFGYMKDLLTQGPGDQVRVSYAFAELVDRERGLGARIGRQSRGMAGIPSTFDGVLGTWQWRPDFGFGLAAGMPTVSTREGPDPDRRFISAGANFANSSRSWDSTAYMLAQEYKGLTDRRSFGVETRYMAPGRTLFALVDYDLHFADFNSVMLLGTLFTESRWTLSLDASRQRSPQLSLRNAMIGQPLSDFDTLADSFTEEQLQQLALDRSAQLTQFGLSAAHPLGERGQWTMNIVSLDLSGTPASGGVEAILAPGRDDAVYTEFLVNSLFKAGDVHSVALRYQQGDGGKLMSLGIGSRLPFGSALRMTSRLRVDHRADSPVGASQLIFAPSLRLDYVRGRATAELEAGAELGQNERVGQSEDSTRYFISLGYRLRLDHARP
jgi:tetratricopeptide (TPR) repeat protein